MPTKTCKPVRLTDDEWLAIAFVIADYSDSNNANQQLRNLVREKIGEDGEIAAERGVAPSRRGKGKR